ncbi:MAG: hypothetical protein NUW37_05465 [Planctomycetes bacterium]|nr:hypothetical protein [Planctomycetota bacterium]
MSIAAATKWTKFYKELVSKYESKLTLHKMSPMELILFCILLENSSSGRARKALDEIHSEFVDYNELRVARVFQIDEVLARAKVEDSFDKAKKIKVALTNIHEKEHSIKLDVLFGKPLAELKKYLQALDYIGDQGIDAILQYCFEYQNLALFADLKIALIEAGLIDASDTPRAVTQFIFGTFEKHQVNEFCLYALEYGSDLAQSKKKKIVKLIEEEEAKNAKPKKGRKSDEGEADGGKLADGKKPAESKKKQALEKAIRDKVTARRKEKAASEKKAPSKATKKPKTKSDGKSEVTADKTPEKKTDKKAKKASTKPAKKPQKPVTKTADKKKDDVSPKRSPAKAAKDAPAKAAKDAPAKSSKDSPAKAKKESKPKAKKVEVAKKSKSAKKKVEPKKKKK